MLIRPSNNSNLRLHYFSFLLAAVLILGFSKITWPKDVNEALRLHKQASLLDDQGRYAEAVKLEEQALAIAEKVFGPQHLNVAAITNNLALFYTNMGEYDRAEPLYKRVLAIKEKKLGPAHPSMATSLNHLALLYGYLGDYAKAVPIFKQALTIYEKAQGPEHPDTARALNNLAELYRNIGDYAQAEPLHKRAFAIRQIKLGSDHPDTALSLNNLALLYEGLGDYIGAETLYKRALGVLEEKLGDDHPHTLTVTNNLAALYDIMGDYAQAEPLYKRALQNREKTLGEGHPDTAISINNLGMLYMVKRDYERAEFLFKRALAVWGKALGDGHPHTAVAINNLATLYLKMGDHYRAETLYKQALAINKKTLGPMHQRTSSTFSSLAMLYGMQGKYEESLRFFQKGLSTQDMTMQNYFSIVSEKLKLQFVKSVLYTYEGALSLIQQKFAANQEALQKGFYFILSRKGIVFDAQARQREAIASTLDPRGLELWSQLNSNRASLAKLHQNKPDKLSYDIYKEKIVILQGKIEMIESQLATMSSLVTEHLNQRKVTVGRVAKHLNKDMVLVEFVLIRDRDWKKGEWNNTRQYLAFILHPDQRIDLIVLGDAEKIDSNIQTFLSRLTGQASNNTTVKYQLKASEDLHANIWKPLLSAIGSAKKVVISPDGMLNLVPFGALRDENGKFLLERQTTSYVTSGRDILRGKAGVKPESDLFLAADPNFNLKAQIPSDEGILMRRYRSAKFTMKFDSLPGTAQEAKFIPELLPGKAKRVVTGDKATEFAVISTRRPKVMHLATHGFFLKDQPKLAYTEARGLSIQSKKGTEMLPKGYENPLIRSGLIFAGANNATEAKTNMDGLLTALEVSGMDLHGTDLVTLSACETGVGEVKIGEGVYGLRRAFAISGAKNLVLSLWPVSDTITAEQMINFYRLYGKGMAPSEALRQAQLKTIAQLRKQYGLASISLWAPFILQGTGLQGK